MPRNPRGWAGGSQRRGRRGGARRGARDEARATRGSPRRGVEASTTPARRRLSAFGTTPASARPRSVKPSATNAPTIMRTMATSRGRKRHKVRMTRRGGCVRRVASAPTFLASPPRASDGEKTPSRAKTCSRAQIANSQPFLGSNESAPQRTRHGARPSPRRLGRFPSSPPSRGRRERGPADVHAFVGRVSASAADVRALLQAVQDARAARRASRAGATLPARSTVRRLRQALPQPGHPSPTPRRTASESAVQGPIRRRRVRALPRRRAGGRVVPHPSGGCPFEIRPGPEATGARSAVALDCEMVGTEPDGSGAMCARVCVVDDTGATLLSTHVAPTAPVTDHRTSLTGITPGSHASAPSIDDVRARVLSILDHGRTLLVGHDLAHDLECLGIDHPRAAAATPRDTPRSSDTPENRSSFEPFRRTARRGHPSRGRRPRSEGRRDGGDATVPRRAGTVPRASPGRRGGDVSRGTRPEEGSAIDAGRRESTVSMLVRRRATGETRASHPAEESDGRRVGENGDGTESREDGAARRDERRVGRFGKDAIGAARYETRVAFSYKDHESHFVIANRRHSTAILPRLGSPSPADASHGILSTHERHAFRIPRLRLLSASRRPRRQPPPPPRFRRTAPTAAGETSPPPPPSARGEPNATDVNTTRSSSRAWFEASTDSATARFISSFIAFTSSTSTSSRVADDGANDGRRRERVSGFEGARSKVRSRGLDRLDSLAPRDGVDLRVDHLRHESVGARASRFVSARGQSRRGFETRPSMAAPSDGASGRNIW